MRVLAWKADIIPFDYRRPLRPPGIEPGTSACFYTSALVSNPTLYAYLYPTIILPPPFQHSRAHYTWRPYLCTYVYQPLLHMYLSYNLPSKTVHPVNIHQKSRILFRTTLFPYNINVVGIGLRYPRGNTQTKPNPEKQTSCEAKLCRLVRPALRRECGCRQPSSVCGRGSWRQLPARGVRV